MTPPESRLPRVSVIIPFLDSERYLPRAVDSLFRQTCEDWELILVDGGSRDGSREQARELARRHPGRVRALRHRGGRPLGIFQSRLLGAGSARAPLIALLDSDDEWQPDLLQRHLAAYRKAFGSKRGLLYCPALHFQDDAPAARAVALQAVPRPGLHPAGRLTGEWLAAGYVKTPTATSTLFDRRILLEAASIRRRVGRHMFEDMYFWFYAVLRHPVFVSARPLVWYRQHPSSISARGRRIDESARRRREHLRWLLGHVLESRLPRRDAVAETVRAALRETGVSA